MLRRESRYGGGKLTPLSACARVGAGGTGRRISGGLLAEGVGVGGGAAFSQQDEGGGEGTGFWERDMLLTLVSMGGIWGGAAFSQQKAAPRSRTWFETRHPAYLPYLAGG